jgi:hypothetical protein
MIMFRIADVFFPKINYVNEWMNVLDKITTSVAYKYFMYSNRIFLIIK